MRLKWFATTLAVGILTAATGTRGDSVNLARETGTAVSSTNATGANMPVENLRDGSLAKVCLFKMLKGASITFTLATEKAIDNIVIHTPSGPDWALPRKIRVALDGRPPLIFDCPNHYNYAIVLPIGYRSKTVTLTVDEVHTESPLSQAVRKQVSPWGGFSEIEINTDTNARPAGTNDLNETFSTGQNGGWHGQGSVTATAEPTVFHSAPGALKISGNVSETQTVYASYGPEFPLTPEKKYRLSAWIKADFPAAAATPPRLAMVLRDTSAERRYINTITLPALTCDPKKRGQWQELQAVVTIPAAGRKLSGALVLSGKFAGAFTVILDDLSFQSLTPSSTAAIKLPARWKFQLDPNWNTLATTTWATPTYEDQSWSNVNVPGDLAKEKILFYGGLGWFRAQIELPQTARNTSLKFNVGRVSGDDRCFFNGVEIGETIGIGSAQEKRPDYDVPADAVNADGKNVVAVRMAAGFLNPAGICGTAPTLRPFNDNEYAIKISSQYSGNLYTKKQAPAKFKLAVLAGANPEYAAGTLAYEIRNAGGKVIDSGRKLIEIRNGICHQEIDSKLTAPGYYEVEATLTAENRILARHTVSAGVLFDLSGPRGAVADSPFGINLGCAISRKASWYDDLPLLHMIGIDWVRSEINWDITERQPGVYDWTIPDLHVAEFRRHQVKLFPILITVPLWNSSAPAGEKSAWKKIFYEPKDFDSWKKFVGAAVARYHKDIPEWEVWNEPNHGVGEAFWSGGVKNFCRLALLAAEAIRAADSQAVIVGPGLAQTDPGFIDKMGKHGALSGFDAISYHPYRHNVTPEEDETPLAFWDSSFGNGNPYREQDALLEAMCRYGKEKPLYIDEFGWTIKGEGMVNVSPQVQADYLVRYHVMNLPRVKRLFWYEFRNRVTGLENMAILHADKTPLPAAVAFNVMVHNLRDTTPKGRLPLGNDLYAFAFAKNGKTVSVIWSTRGEQTICLLPEEELTVTDMLGQPLLTIPRSKITAWSAGGSPQYIHGQFKVVSLLTPGAAEITVAPNQKIRHNITLSNPYDKAISGRLTAQSDEAVTVSAPATAGMLHLEPGASQQIAFELQARPAAAQGRHEVKFRFEYNRDWQMEQAVRPISVNVVLPSGPRQYIQDWLLCGPFTANRKSGLMDIRPFDESAAAPKAGTEAGGHKWFKYTRPADIAKRSYPAQEAVDFLTAGIKGEYGVAYAFTNIWSPAATRAVLQAGSDDGIAVWLNGKQCLRHELMRGVKLDDEAVEVALKPGWNTLLIKVSQELQGWAFAVRLTDLEGRQLQGVKYSVETEP